MFKKEEEEREEEKQQQEQEEEEQKHNLEYRQERRERERTQKMPYSKNILKNLAGNSNSLKCETKGNIQVEGEQRSRKVHQSKTAAE